MFSLGGSDIVEANVLLPTAGMWCADVMCNDDTINVVGDTVDLTLDSLVLKGTIVGGSANPDSARFRVVGGNGNWGRVLAPRSYSSTDGVKLTTVVSGIAEEAGETIEVHSSLQSHILGGHWMRLRGTAACALDRLGMGWRVRPDGVGVVGPLDETTSTQEFSVRRYHAHLGKYVIDVHDADAILELQPGVSFEADGFSVRATTVRWLVKDASLWAEVQEP